MSELKDSRLDSPQPDMLSARSYLELGLGAPQTHHSDELHTPDSLPATDRTHANPSQENQGKSAPHPAKPTNSEKTVTVGHQRKRGRPRLETTKDAAAIEERRLQIRRAQRTYRQKKEATIQALKTRVELLEQTLQNVSDLMQTETSIIESSNNRITGRPTTRHLVLAEIEKAQQGTSSDTHDLNDQGHLQDHQAGHNTSRDIFGYHLANPQETAFEEALIKNNIQEQLQERAYPHPRSPSPLTNRLFPTTTIYTYSYQESDLSRRLQRFCLEHTYRWLSDPRSHPDLLSRVFGLVPCIHDMPGIRRSYRRILQSEIGDPLEVEDKLPYYKLGGAGTHYPRIGRNGQFIYPYQLRRPGKIIRRMSRILQRGGIHDWDEDWSGNVDLSIRNEVQGDSTSFGEPVTMSENDRLRALDLDGKWFDCHDIQGYLEDRGVVLSGSSMWMEVPSATVSVLAGPSPEFSASQYYVSPGEGSSGVKVKSGSQGLGSSSSRYVLDVESFFDLLLANLRILGRAPGFRLVDVDVALRAAIHRRPLS